jgi:hypothetical protein
VGRPTKPMHLGHDTTGAGEADTGAGENQNPPRKNDVPPGKRSRRSSRISTRLSRSSVRVSLSAMNISATKRNWLPPLINLAHNPLTLAGLFLVNAAAVFWLFVLPVATQDGARHPYLLIVFFGCLPIAFIIGLAAIPLGLYLRYRKQTRGGLHAREFDALGWDNREFRQISLFVVGATCCNVLLGGYVSQHTVHYMDSPGFCSTTCHSMSPEYVAYQDSPHRNIDCVECHIGSGRRAYARAKLNGLWQVTATVFELYPTPIQTPLENLRPARDICESCHWPQNFSGVEIRVLNHFAKDSANTWTKTVLALRVGGGSSTTGIHGAHVATGDVFEYVASERRQEILWVRHKDSTGVVLAEYESAEWDSVAGTEVEIRTMDCLDCHTRPSHRFQTPERALDNALAMGDIDADLPWIREHGLSTLRVNYASSADAAKQIPDTLNAVYRLEHPAIFQSQQHAISKSAEALIAIYNRNVFPSMGIEWGTYPDNSGHNDSPGCFRCHGSSLRNSAGESISMDCSLCHVILAMRESDPEILTRLGIGQ